MSACSYWPACCSCACAAPASASAANARPTLFPQPVLTYFPPGSVRALGAMLTPVLQVRFFAIQSSRRVHRDYTLLAQPSASAPPLRSRIVSPEPTALRRTNDEN